MSPRSLCGDQPEAAMNLSRIGSFLLREFKEII